MWVSLTNYVAQFSTCLLFTCTFGQINMSVCLSWSSQDTTGASQVVRRAVDYSILSGIYRCHTSVYWHCRLPAFVFTDSSGFAHTGVFRRAWEVGIVGGAEVCELADNIVFVVVDGNDWQCLCIMCHDFPTAEKRKVQRERSNVWRCCGCRMAPTNCHWTTPYRSCHCGRTQSCSVVYVDNRSLREPWRFNVNVKVSLCWPHQMVKWAHWKRRKMTSAALWASSVIVKWRRQCLLLSLQLGSQMLCKLLDADHDDTRKYFFRRWSKDGDFNLCGRIFRWDVKDRDSVQKTESWQVCYCDCRSPQRSQLFLKARSSILSSINGYLLYHICLFRPGDRLRPVCLMSMSYNVFIETWGPPGARGPGARAPMAPLLIRHWMAAVLSHKDFTQYVNHSIYLGHLWLCVCCACARACVCVCETACVRPCVYVT